MLEIKTENCSSSAINIAFNIQEFLLFFQCVSELQCPDISDIADHLQKQYPEYSRKRKNDFRKYVAKIYSHMCEQETISSSSSDSNQRNKRMKVDFFIDKKGDKAADSDFSDENPNYESYEDKNLANSSLMSLYSKPSKKNDDPNEKNQNNLNKESKINSPNKQKISRQNDDNEFKQEVQLTESKYSFSDIGGNDKCLKEVCNLLAHMKHPEVHEKLNVHPPRGFLLHGPPGCGKSLLVQAIAGELKLPLLKIAATEIVSGVSGESEEKLHLNQKTSANQVFVIGATNRQDSLDPALRRGGRFDREICMGIPDQDARLKIFKILCKELKLDPDFDFVLLAKNTPGYVGADLMSLIQEASMIAVDKAFVSLQDNPDITNENETTERDSIGPPYKLLLHWLKEQPPLNDDQLENLCITMKDFESFKPSSLREGFATIPNVTWDDVGALYDVREELKLSILDPTKYPKEFESLGLTKPAGILLCGPPGCGKTLLAKAISNESGINFISVKGPELLSMYVGESERAVRQCFQRAKNSAPCIIFFDELDALCRRRSDEGGSGVRVVDQLLTEMDGLESRKQVHVLGATNRPEIIDPAMLRPGRFDKILYVGLPNKMDREDILKTITSNGTKPKIGEDISLSSIASDERAENLTGADLFAVVREASINAFKRFVKTERISNSCKNQEIVVSKTGRSRCPGETPIKTILIKVGYPVVKKHKRKAGTRMYKNYTEDAVKAAVAAHLAGTSLRDAESEFGVPMRTIKNKADKKHTMPVGKPTIFFRFGRTVSCKAIGEMW
ncbi:Nuclear valosin-containing protein-like [Nymphon striatum]|nr:Nuclear valosin-containing protein-like [Nymphon striatum]